MCFSVWNGEDDKSQSKQIFKWIKKLLDSKASAGGNRKARRKTRKHKRRYRKTRKNKRR